MKDALYRRGMKTRREILGAGREQAIVREEDDFSMPLREFTTRYVWGELWSRKGLPRKTRSLINVALLTAFKSRQELKTHIRGALNNGCSKAEIREVLLQCGIYAGIPVLREAVRVAQEVFAEEAKSGRRVK
jgi:alkylhydroperoxidase/carboxymuconolactone decarboxylase family protein YurZ